jgi:hypothetical protein
VLGCADATTSPPASTVWRLDCLSAVLLPLTACEVPCVRFSKFVRLAPSNVASAFPGSEQHSVSGGWLGLSIHSFRSESCPVLHSKLEGLSPPELTTFAWRTASHFLGASRQMARREPRPSEAIAVGRGPAEPGCLRKGLCFSVVGFLGLDHFFPVSGFEVKNLQKIALFSPGRFFF